MFRMFCLLFKIADSVLGDMPHSLAMSHFFLPEETVLIIVAFYSSNSTFLCIAIHGGPGRQREDLMRAAGQCQLCHMSVCAAK